MRADTVDDRSWLLPPQLTAIQRKQIIDTMTLARCNELTAQKLLLYVKPCPMSNLQHSFCPILCLPPKCCLGAF